MDERTRRLIADWHAIQRGDPSDSFKDVAERWLAELEAERVAREAFMDGLDTLVIRCARAAPHKDC